MKTATKLAATAAAMVLSSHAFACSGFISSVVGNCDLDKLSDAIQQAVPGTRAILNPGANNVPVAPVAGPPAFIPPAPMPPMGLGTMCWTATGLHPLGVWLPIGYSCSGTNAWGVFEVGSVVR